MNGSGLVRIGHGGASALAPANTLSSFDVRAHRGELVLAHTLVDARRRVCVRLSEALAHLSARRFSDVAINLDVKHVGCEAALLEGLRAAGLLNRALISSQVAGALDRVRERDHRVMVGISVGGQVARMSRRWLRWRAQVLDGLAAHRWDALMAQHRLIDHDLLSDVVARNARLYAWTVNRREAIMSLHRLGVHGITTGDPRLFGPAPG